MLGQGQTIKTLAHGLYPVTGGQVDIGYLGNGTVTKVIGIIPNGNIPLGPYNTANQQFNSNLASIFYELRVAGQANLNHSVLDYSTAGRVHSSPTGNLLASYVQSYKSQAGLNSGFETAITDKLLNGIAKQ